MSDWKSYLKQNQAAFVADLVSFLRIPSVSTLPEHRTDVRRAAEWTAARLRRSGIHQVEIMETDGHPVVYGERIESADKPTVLFYGHFDVQPAHPLELWTHPPFEPHQEDGRLFARGASDMKANVLLPIIATEAHLNAHGALPVNVKFLIEGEEELGSPSLGHFLEQHQELLRCDFAVSADGGIGAPDRPLISLGTRGLCGMQVRVQTADVDLHSGNGGYAPNALHALVSIFNSLRDDEGRILVEGFYDDVQSITDSDRTLIASMTPGMDAAMAGAGVRVPFGEPEFTPVERHVARPTLEVNGMWGGFQGDGMKTVIPHEAFAKVTCRLVSSQDPWVIRARLKEQIWRVAPDYAQVSFTDLPAIAYPYHLPVQHVGVAVLQQVIEQASGHQPQFQRSGGTVPVMGMLRQLLGVETITVGASQSDERAHAPNEFLRLNDFERLQEITVSIWRRWDRRYRFTGHENLGHQVAGLVTYQLDCIGFPRFGRLRVKTAQVGMPR